jgi:hypothetical protein
MPRERTEEWHLTDEALRELRKKIPIVRERYDYGSANRCIVVLLIELLQQFAVGQ